MKKASTMHTSVDEIIELAWSDQVSFDDIKALIGVDEQTVKTIMKDSLKPSSYRLWRKRVTGRATKHSRKLKQVNKRP